MNYGYLRGSTGLIDKENQRKSIDKIALERDINIMYVEDTVSSGKKYEERQISTLINQCKSGDLIIVAELSRFARDTEETLKIGRIALEKGINLEIINPSIKFDDSIATKAIITVMGLSAEMERHFIKSRTILALQSRKELLKTQNFFLNKKGEKVFQLGAVKGQSQKLMTQKMSSEIIKYTNLGMSKTAICKFLKISRGSLYRYLDRYPVTKESLKN